jgi:RNA polymerase sigma factor (sigma-70 family)
MTAADAAPDASLAALYIDGDPRAVPTIDAWILRAAFPFRHRLSHQWDDLLQDLRLEIFRLLRDGRFRGDSSLRTYIWRVVGHTCLDRCRALTRRPEVSWESEEGEKDPLPVAAPQADDSTLKDLLLKVQEEVGEDCRRLWQMILLGHSYREMSEQTGVTEGALRVRVLRCRRQAVEIRRRLLGDPSGNGERLAGA